jgi:hypothetical protein
MSKEEVNRLLQERTDDEEDDKTSELSFPPVFTQFGQGWD